MAGNTRGKLKETFEGVHRNLDWTLKHTEAALILIQEKHPHLSEAIKTLQKGVKTLDELAMNIYAKL